MKLDWNKWAYGLIGAIVGGVANSVSAMIVAPETFNFADISKLGKLAVASSIISAALFLKQMPVPPEEKEIKSTP